MLNPKKISTFAPLKRREIRDGFGRMAEWSNAAVLKTVDLHGSGGSNPSSSAKKGSLNAALYFIPQEGLFNERYLESDCDLKHSKEINHSGVIGLEIKVIAIFVILCGSD